MKKYSCIIVDDETLARELLAAHIAKIPFLEVLTTCANAIDAKVAIEKYRPDVLLLDIQMPNLSGLELLKVIKYRPAVILTTAFSEHALKGYELDIIDYLLKPIEFDRFFKAVSKAVEWLVRGSPVASPSTNLLPAGDEYFFVKSDYKIVKVIFAEILFVEAVQKYGCIHTAAGRIVTLMPIGQLEASLPQGQFIRIHRSYIVNLEKVDSIEGNMVHIQKHDLPVSKGQRDVFLEMVRKKGLGM